MQRRRLTLFVKGNADLRDPLHAYRAGGALLWNGLNEALRAQGLCCTARIRHETFARSDVLLGAAHPDEGSADRLRALPLGPYPVASQWSRALFDAGARSDAVVLSIQPDVTATLGRHRGAGYLLFPYLWEQWGRADQDWFTREFEPCGPLSPEQSMGNLAAIVGALQRVARPPAILIANMSASVGDEWVHCHRGLDEALSTRIRRFNLALIGLSRETGLSIIDVDGIVARAGADRVKLGPSQLNAEGCRLVAEGVVRVLDDLLGLTEV